MTNENSLAVILKPKTPPAIATRQTTRVLNGGAGRGAQLNIPHIRDFNSRSQRFVIRPIYVDPVPGRAQALAEEAGQSGVPADFREGTIQEFLDGPQEFGAVILNLDSPGAVADVLRREPPVPVSAYQMVRMPDDRLFGVAVVVRPEDAGPRQECIRFFESLQMVTARSGSNLVVGERSRPEHRLAEPSHRAWFGRHMQDNLPKVLAGLEPERNPFELTADGQASLPILVRDNRQQWAEPTALATEVLEGPPMPLLRGEDFMVGELGPDGIRLHRLRLRKTDGQMAIRGGSFLDPASIEAAKKRALREALSRLRPALTTD